MHEIRINWASPNLDREAAIVRAVLDYATIKPGSLRVPTMDPNRIVPTWRL